MHELSNEIDKFDLRWPLEVKGQAFEWKKYYWTQVTSKGQRSRSNPKNFEVKYLKNGTRYREKVSLEVIQGLSTGIEKFDFRWP